MIQEKLTSLGFDLPKAAPAAANYVPYTLHNGLLTISGQLPFLNGEKNFIGRLGEDMDVAQGQKAAQACALNILAQLNRAMNGDISRVQRCLRLGGFVNATPDFTDHPTVINGASDLIALVLGEVGRHARFAVGAGSLPFGVAVEIDASFAISE